MSVPDLRDDATFYRLAAMDHLFWRGRPSQSPRFAQKAALANAARRRDGFDVPRPAISLPSLPADATRDDLLEATDGLHRPVVVRGFAQSMPAVQRWTEARLRQELGDVPCMVFIQNASSRQESWDRGTQMEQVRFSEYLDRRRNEPLYLNNSTELFLARPDILEELQLKQIRERFHTPGSRWDELVTANLFLGGRAVFSAIHCALAGNCFLEVAGRKRWVFIDPAYGPHLHAIPGRPFQYLKSAYGGSRAAEERGEQSVISCLPRYEVVLEPGDLLYNPPWWWHEVDNLDEFTIGVALRHLPPPPYGSPSWDNHKVWSLLSSWPSARVMIWAHWLVSQMSNTVPSVRDFLGERQARQVRKGLSR
ncbi:MAG: cupin-like domain-containing protein [Myxococcota bacterium]